VTNMAEKDGGDHADYDILVVGLGPVGAMLTALLINDGWKVLAIDRDAQAFPLPRAAGVDHEVMRAFQRLGITDAVLPHTCCTRYYAFVDAKGDTLLQFDRKEPSISGWQGNYTFYQPAVEQAVRNLLSNHDNATLKLSTRLLGFEQDEDGITAELSTQADSQAIVKTTQVRASYLIGCDGASSTVRKQCDIELQDFGFDEPWLVVDTFTEHGGALPERNLQVCDPMRPTTFLRLGPGRYRWEFMIKPEESAEGIDVVLSDDSVESWIAPWIDPKLLKIERKAVYRFHGLLARKWRHGRVLLAGDAAHQMPPFAGQGLCSGVRDALNLFWKLTEVLSARADAILLDTYEIERSPHVQAIIEEAIRMGRIVCTLDPTQAQQRDVAIRSDVATGRPGISMKFPAMNQGYLVASTPGAGQLFPQPWVSHITDAGVQQLLKLDDFLGLGAALIRRPSALNGSTAPTGGSDSDPDLDRSATMLGVKLIDLSSPRFGPFASVLLKWLDERDAHSVLIRPDRYVFGTGSPTDLLTHYAAMRVESDNTQSAPSF
jgi:3-(3-hydroxy-phenyl)propionate hydroxylase